MSRCAKNRLFAVVSGMGLAVLILAPVTPASAAKGGKGRGGGGNSSTAFQRAVFSDMVDGSSAGIRGDGLALSLCDGLFDYWTTLDGGDPECTPGGNVFVGLTGPDGLWFETHDGSTNLNDGLPPGDNRHFTLDFSRPLEGGPCLYLDTEFYGSVPDEVVGYVPMPNPDPCVDNVEALLRVGTGIFDLPQGVSAGPATLEVMIPSLNQKGKKSAIEWQQIVTTLTFFSPLIVTDTEIGDDDLTLTCFDACIVSVRKQGVELGEYNMPVQLRVKRVLCDNDGVCTP